MVYEVDGFGRVVRVYPTARVDSLDGRAVPTLEENEYRTNPFAILSALFAGSLVTIGLITATGIKILQR